jgi:hypothetical protein
LSDAFTFFSFCPVQQQSNLSSPVCIRLYDESLEAV